MRTQVFGNNWPKIENRHPRQAPNVGISFRSRPEHQQVTKTMSPRGHAKPLDSHCSLASWPPRSHFSATARPHFDDATMFRRLPSQTLDSVSSWSASLICDLTEASASEATVLQIGVHVDAFKVDHPLCEIIAHDMTLAGCQNCNCFLSA